MARIFTSRIRPSGRSRVVFINARFPEIWFSVKICLEIVPLLTGNLGDNLNQERADDDPIADRDLLNIAPLQFGEQIVHSSLLNRLLRREGGDDFLEARIAAQRVPEGEQLKHAVA